MNRVVGLATLLLLVFFFFGIHLVALPQFDNNRLSHRDGERLLTTPDSYFYLKLGRDLQTGQYGPHSSLGPSVYPDVPPLITTVTIGLSDLLGVRMERVAFFLSPVLACLLIPLLWGASRHFFPESHVSAIAACLALTFNFVLLRRTCIGYYDTDALNVVLIWGALGASYLFTVVAGRLRWLALLAFLFCITILFFWWRPASLPFAAVSLMLYACSLLTCEEQWKWERWGKVILFVGGAGFFVISILGLQHFLPSLVQPISLSLKVHLNLISGSVDTPFFNMGETIEELARPDLHSSLVDLGGSVFTAILFIAGLYPVMKKSRTAAMYVLGVFLLFTGASLGGRRFLLFLVPLIALGCGGLCFWLINELKRFTPVKKTAPVLGGVLVVVLLYPAAGQSISYKPEPTFNSNAVKLASLVDKIVPEDGQLWNWWGPGYLLQYYGKRKTLIDGGSQEPYLSYLTAIPLASPSPVLSRNWIRFFTVHRDGLHAVNGFIGNYADSVQFLVNIFLNPDTLESEARRVGLPEGRSWDEYFFPEADVYLVLFSDMLIRGSWLAIGRTLPGSKEKLHTPFFGLDMKDCKIDLNQGRIEYKGAELPYGMIFSVTPEMLSHSPGQKSDKVAIAITDVEKIFYMDRNQFDCLVFRLLFVHPVDTPYFSKIAYNPFVGGLWKVE